MDFVLTPKDVEWIHTQHPGLKIDRSNKKIVGDIFIDRSYNDIALFGFFSIEIELYIRPNTTLPKVYETSNRLEDIADKLNKSNLDIHVNNDKSLCMVIADKEHECFQSTFTLQEFFENCIEPYFYWIMYYEQYDEMPWKEYAHRELGFFELYAENELSYKKLVKKFNIFELHKYLLVDVNGKCLCGSGKDMKICHPLVHEGLYKMQNMRLLQELKINVERGINITIPLTSPTVYTKIS